MASLNLSINGPSIRSSYNGVVNAPTPPAGSSSTYAHWALFTVQAPLANAFQDSGNKESILKVQSTGEGELEELNEEFSEGRVQFAFLKIRDPNSGLPKHALIAWCGGGVPERTKGYFTSHLSAVTKVLHGYHVQITARSDTDLEPATILQKIADASGSKYTAGGSAPVKASGGPPPVKTKPVFASAGGTISFNPIIAARNANLKNKNTDADGWGDDAPPVTRSEIQKVESAYKPTKVNMAELTSQKQEPSRSNNAAREEPPRSDVIGGGYQPVGKVDIAAIRAAAKDQKDDRPAPVKGTYEPVGKVDIAAIKARAQPPSESDSAAAPRERGLSLSERKAAFDQAERLTELPKPKVAKKWSGASTFTGTKAPTPGALGFGGPSPAAGAPPVGSASRTFADQGGKTPAQIWAEKKAAQGGTVPRATSPIAPQTSGSHISPQASGNKGGWQSGYSGKSWKPVQTGSYGRGIAGQKTGDTATSQEAEAPPSPSGSVGAIRERFRETQQAAPPPPKVPGPSEEEERGPPPPPMGTRPAAGAPSGGFALPGMPPRPPPVTDEEEEEERSPSPVRVAVPVPRGPEPEIEPAHEPPRSLPVRSIEHEAPREEHLPAEEDSYDPRAAATAVAAEQFGHGQAEEASAAASGGKRALIQYDYEKAEDNEIDLREGEYITNIDMVDDDWWMGTNSSGDVGLFPSNYVEIVEDEDAAQPTAAAPPAPAPAPAPVAAEPEPAAPTAAGPTATAEFDYEAAEDNGTS
ncbi:actin binding protein [Diatrype stigma]|uniref:Actin binding protein n=1 Tax=Diatrype stigma TaxID=117547 RepID=A0AAN9V060_9PEZI